jgi:PKD repeat protein
VAGLEYNFNGAGYAATTSFATLTPGTYSVVQRRLADITCVSNSVNFTIAAVPTAITASANVTTAIVCNGGVGTITIIASGGVGTLNYTFNGVSNSTGIFNSVSAGIGYAWNVNDSYGCGPVTGTLNVTEPAAIATSVISGSTTPACNATGISYNVTNTPGSSYAWTVPSGATITTGGTGPDNNAITVDFGNSNGNVTVQETNSTGCLGTLQTLGISLQGCSLNADFTASTTTVCAGSSVTFTNTSTGTSGSTTYNWDFGANATPATANTIGPHNVTYSTSGAKTIILIVTEGAFDTETKNNYITVNARPTSVVSGTATICNGSSTTISVALTGAQPWALTWSDGTTPTVVTGITTNPYTFSPSPSANTTYTVTALSDNNTCTAQAGDMTGSALISVDNTISLTIGATVQVCDYSDFVTLSDVTITNETAILWTGGSGTITNTNSANPTYTPALSEGGTTITLSVDASNSCGTLSNTKQIIIHKSPTLNPFAP